MLMEEVFSRFKRFQEIMTERVAIEHEVDDIPKSLATQEELLARVQKSSAEKNDELEAARARLAELRNQLAEAEASREHAEKQMDSIETQREYEALNKEIRDAGDREHTFRKDLQREERTLLEIEEVVKRDESMIRLQEQDIAEMREKVQNLTHLKQDRVGELKAMEAETTDGIDPEIVFKFERIIRSKKGVGIVPIKGLVCTGCSMILPAQFVNDVRQGNRIIFCPYCSRVLYHQETNDLESNFLVDIESGSLADLDDFSEEGEDDNFDEADDDGEKGAMDDSDE
ncbi:MAG: C4-type zinc ribbon domain-containing protein [Spirochaetes bacterium]|nr:C4-type zinc ribbon domain-containing protein [Spirochaetota bacterium]